MGSACSSAYPLSAPQAALGLELWEGTLAHGRWDAGRVGGGTSDS